MTLVPLKFSKYTGCGNDFILVDHREPFFPYSDPSSIQKLCHRQKGIGADGVIFLEKSLKADFRMRIFNADGSEAEMCGNGLRCLAKFLQELELKKEHFSIETMERILDVHYHVDGIQTTMGEPKNLQLNIELTLDGKKILVHFVDTGVPHVVLFVDQLSKISVSEIGKKIRHHPHFAPKGTNVNFVEKLGPGKIAIRTFERGVEAETLACGTGAAAAAIISAIEQNWTSPIEVATLSQDKLIINFTIDKKKCISNVTQTGPAIKLFFGTT